MNLARKIRCIFSVQDDSLASPEDNHLLLCCSNHWLKQFTIQVRDQSLCIHPDVSLLDADVCPDQAKWLSTCSDQLGKLPLGNTKQRCCNVEGNVIGILFSQPLHKFAIHCFHLLSAPDTIVQMPPDV